MIPLATSVAPAFAKIDVNNDRFRCLKLERSTHLQVLYYLRLVHTAAAAYPGSSKLPIFFYAS